jgi:hypothetical protein
MSGVLTKADTVEEGNHEHWLKVINNESHRLRQGYYMTRLPGSSAKEAKQDWDETREIERKFFKKGPWSETRDKSRLGIDGLIKALSTGLEERVERRSRPFLSLDLRGRLPKLKNEISAGMAKVQERLGDLKVPDDPQQMLWEICKKFTSQIVDCANGNSMRSSFFKDMNSEFEKLSESIIGTRPVFKFIQPEASPDRTDSTSISSNISSSKNVAFKKVGATPALKTKDKLPHGIKQESFR